MPQTFRLFEAAKFELHATLSFTDDSHHILSRVLRMEKGDSIEVLNGKGEIAKAVLLETKSKFTKVEIHAIEKHERVSPSVGLYVASLKGEKLSWVLQKATELGASTLGLFISDHSIAMKSESILDKAQKTVVEAMRQSGNPYLPTLHFYKTIQDIPFEKNAQHVDLLLDESTDHLFSAFAKEHSPASINIFVGPEGGFSSQEKLFFGSKGCYSIRIAPYVLRSETAAISALSACMAVFGRK